MREAARLLRHARKRSGLTQRALAAKAGVSPRSVARIESSRVDPRTATLARLVRACGMTLEAMQGTGEGVDLVPLRAMLSLTPAERILVTTAEQQEELVRRYLAAQS